MVFVGVALLVAGLAVSAVALANRSAPGGRVSVSDAEAELIARDASRAIVGIEAETCAGTMVGSGFVAGGRVVTSGHLVAGAADLAIAGAGAAPVRLAVGGTLHPADLAFSAQFPPSTAAPEGGLAFAPGPPAEGAAVVVAARVGGRLRWLVAGARTVDGGAYGGVGPLLLLDRPVAPGWSGGPVLNRSGRVVGVVRAVDGSTGVTLAEPVDERHVPERAWRENDIERAAPISCKSDQSMG
ncbi:MAG: S1C family serine protease [Acidimicrobiales bacterium]